MIDYKLKYQELRQKFLNMVDVSFRQGYEQGLKEGQVQAQLQMQQMQMQQMQQDMAAQQAMQQNPQLSPEEQAMQGEVSPEEQAMQEQQMQQQAAPQEQIPTELDMYIAELENMVAKGEKPSVVDLRKKINEISDFTKKHKDKQTIYKKAEPTAQKKIVDSLIKKWEVEASKIEDDLQSIIEKQGIDI